jgi:hypothetical protein
MLICKFASRHSSPTKIATWINYLEEIHEKHQEDNDAVQVIESLLAQARGWVRGEVYV